MVRIFKISGFARFQRKERIADAALIKAIKQAEDGLVDADLGAGLIKQRVARPGQGKSGGFRTIIAFRLGDRAVFLFGFAKSKRSNIDDEELDELRSIADAYFALNAAQLEELIEINELTELSHDEAD